MEFILALGVWGWILVAAVMAVGILISETGAFYGGGLLLLGTLVYMKYVLGIALLAFVMANWLGILGAVILYVGLGGVYTALWKWPDYLRSNSAAIKDEFNEAKRSHRSEYDRAKNQNQNKDLPADVDAKYVELTAEEYIHSYKYRWSASRHKALLATWTQMWIFSIIWDMSHRPFIWIYETVYDSFGKVFDAIGKRIARRILQ